MKLAALLPQLTGIRVRSFSAKSTLRVGLRKLRLCGIQHRFLYVPPNESYFDELTQKPALHASKEPALPNSPAVEDELLYAGLFRHEIELARSQGSDFVRQIRLEEDSIEEAFKQRSAMCQQLLRMGQGTGFKRTKNLLLKWYEPLVKEITDEIKLVEMKSHGVDRTTYGPVLFLLPPEQLALITLDTTVNTILSRGNEGVLVSQVVARLGDLVEAEVNLVKYKMTKEGMSEWKIQLLERVVEGFAKSKSKGVQLSKRIRDLLDSDDWGTSFKVKVGASLLSLLLRGATVDVDGSRPAFIHTVIFNRHLKKQVSSIRMDAVTFASLVDEEDERSMPRFLPMLVPPRLWDNKVWKQSCFFRQQARLMRTRSREQLQSLAKADMPHVLKVLNHMGAVPWRVNATLLEVVKTCWEQGILIGELPRKKDLEKPLPSEVIRPPKPWVKRKAAEAEAGTAAPVTAPLSAEQLAEREKLLDERYYKDMCRRVDQKNAELHSLRCDLILKIGIAEKFIDDKIYFPYSIDFRGRAYPVPPNLNHLGSDLSRALLWFDEEKALGEKGLFWFKVHLANLFGNNKISHADRVAWADQHLDKIHAAADSPLGGTMQSETQDSQLCNWWTTAEKPFQALATCIEISRAIRSGCPESYLTRLPVHQDGSCNGLQHYAALGRDLPGAISVNLCPAEAPMDVYSRVLDIVVRKIDEDAELPEDDAKGVMARRLKGHVVRKVIKQTVMTSVYGVTKRGALLQVLARLEERMIANSNGLPMTPDQAADLRRLARYLAEMTLESLQELFVSAKDIMDWLGTLSVIVANQGMAMSWITPLGIPVMQPYRKNSTFVVRTLMQSISLYNDDDSLPVSNQKQRTAFPPNFVHSLDATHMILTAMRMQERGITFASVHDSYWVHPSEVDEMNKQLREAFVQLYSEPILESLLSSLQMRYPDVSFPPVPTRGELDIRRVLESTYFFH